MGRSRGSWLPKVKKQVWRKFPDMDSVEPRVSSRALVRKGMGLPGNGEREQIHTLTFRKKVVLEDGSRSTQIVRVVTDDDGHILKVVCNR